MTRPHSGCMLGCGALVMCENTLRILQTRHTNKGVKRNGSNEAMSSYWDTSSLPDPPTHVVSYESLRKCIAQVQDPMIDNQCMDYYFKIYRAGVKVAAERTGRRRSD